MSSSTSDELHSSVGADGTALHLTGAAVHDHQRRRLLLGGVGVSIGGALLPKNVLAEKSGDPVIDAYVTAEN